MFMELFGTHELEGACMPTNDEERDLPKEVHAEREKTKRTLIVASAITIVGVLATVLFFQNIDNRGGTLKVSDKGVEVTLEKPLTTQLGTSTEQVQAFGDSVSFTTGTISDSALRSLPVNVGSSGFNGQNLIDTATGFVLPSDRPSAWNLEKTAGGQSKLTANDGSAITVSTRAGSEQDDLNKVVHKLLDSLSRAGTKAKTRMDSSEKTVLVWYRDADSQETVCVKYVQANNRIYTARATTKDPSSVSSLVKSVSGFTVISKVLRPQRLPTVPSTRRLPR